MVHVLFWAVAASGDATLAVVGTDVRQTGHFVYSTVSDWAAGPPLRCTNRGVGADTAAERRYCSGVACSVWWGEAVAVLI